MFENSHTAEEKLHGLLKQYGAGEIHGCSDGVYWTIGNNPKECIIVLHKEAEDESIVNSTNIRVEVFTSYNELRKNKFFIDCLKNDCLEGGCWERLGKLYDWVERGTKDNAPHPADMWYSNAIETVTDAATWYLEDEMNIEIGSFVIDEDNLKPFIYAGRYYDKQQKQVIYKSYCGINSNGELITECSESWCSKQNIYKVRIAAEYEKKPLLDKLNELGYTWNNKTKGLEYTQRVSSLKTGELILVRDDDTEEWLPAFFGRYVKTGDVQQAQIIDSNKSIFSQYIKYDEKLAYTNNKY